MNQHMRLVSNLARPEPCSGEGISCRCFLSDLSAESLRNFKTISLTGFYPRGAKLFAEGEQPRGVFIVCSGRVKLLISSINGKSLMRIAGPGEILGLSATISGQSYEGSAEILDSGQVTFIRRELFLGFLTNQAKACLRIAQLISEDYLTIHEQMCDLTLSNSVTEKLAKLLLRWCNKDGRLTEQGFVLKLSLTHGEIAQMIGVSRETVTRLLGEWRTNGIIHLKGSNLVIKDKAKLETLTNS